MQGSNNKSVSNSHGPVPLKEPSNDELARLMTSPTRNHMPNAHGAKPQQSRVGKDATNTIIREANGKQLPLIAGQISFNGASSGDQAHNPIVSQKSLPVSSVGA